MKNPAEFWTNRYRKLGHTGWKNPAFYAYDQLERLALFREQLTLLNIEPKKALDFGCGSGDFSRMLLEKGSQVWGYDLYVNPQISHPRFVYLGSQDELKSFDENMDLIISVTVLDHILDTYTMRQELSNLHRLIYDEGYLILLEYALDAPSSKKNHYQAFRTIQEWQAQLSASGWNMIGMRPVPHPQSAPSGGFVDYRNRRAVALLEKALNVMPTNSWLRFLLQRYALKIFSENGLQAVEASPLKLMWCQSK